MESKIIGQISEIFNGIQGEGPYLGTKQAFIRFYGCNLDCRFCDTKQFFFRQYSVSEVTEKMRLMYHLRFVSITGGEPLLQVEFLRLLLPALKKEFKIYLETNGTLVSQLSSIIDFIDIISMDFKLPSSTGLKSYFDEQREFLKIAKEKEVFVKAVITDSTTFEDVKFAVSIISSIDNAILFVLQPDTNQLGKILFAKMNDYRTYALEYLNNVRIIPQMHRLVGLR